jgi:ribosome maturation protein Sdo1
VTPIEWGAIASWCQVLDKVNTALADRQLSYSLVSCGIDPKTSSRQFACYSDTRTFALKNVTVSAEQFHDAEAQTREVIRQLCED